MPASRPETIWQRWSHDKWFSRAPYFLGAILLHLVLILLLATLIIFRAPAPHNDDASFSSVKVKLPPPPPPALPSASGGEAQNAQEPDVTVTPPPTALSIVVSNTSQAFSVNSTKVAMPNVPSQSRATGSALADTGASGSGHGTGSVFGSDSSGGNGFAGSFYDLKQSQTRVQTGMNDDKELVVIRDFLKNGWNEDSWTGKYLKSTKQLYANELLVPLIESKEGPKAYGLERVCQPGYWCAIYHLKVTPTHSGTFRVAGFGDDYLVVRVNGDIVLDSGWFPPVTNFKREKTYLAKWLNYTAKGRPDYGQTVVGAPFRTDIGESLTIDVLLGDANPAEGKGKCGYFLFLLEDGKQYDKDPGGNPIFPVLQVEPEPDLKRSGYRPPFTCKPEDALIGS